MSKHIQTIACGAFILVLSLCLSPSVLNAREYVPTFFDMDKDGDGVISKEEAGYWSLLVRHWKEFDANANGSIDLKEWEGRDIGEFSSDR